MTIGALPVPPLPPDALRRRYDPDRLGFRTTEEVADSAAFVGQPRAEAAVAFGIGMARDGYNLFALGEPGSGRRTLIGQYLTAAATRRPAPPDLCYVHNFAEPHRPKLLTVPAGTGAALRRDMEHLVEELRTVLAGAFESEEYLTRRKVIEDEFKDRPQQALQDIEQRARQAGLALIRTPVGMAFAPVREGEVLSGEEFQRLPAEEQQRLEKLVESFEEEVHRTLRQLPRWDRERRTRVRELDREITNLAVGHLLDEMRQTYAAHPAVLDYLHTVQQDVIEHAREIVQPESPLPPALAELAERAGGGPAPLARYQVNLLVDHAETRGAPVVSEDHPTYDNLVGRIEHLSRFGALVTDFTLIKPGALHRANGGYLVLDANKVLRAPYAWEALKRALRSRRVRIESLGQALSLVSTVSLEPEPLELDVTVVLIGERLLYYLLLYYDPEFQELFKISADFDDALDATQDNLRRYVLLVASIVRNDGLRPFDRGAVARVLEQATRLAGDRDKLTASLRALADLLHEADYWAGDSGVATVGAEHVQRAIDAQVHRADRLRERLYEEIEHGTIKIDTSGATVGQVNGLSVLALGTFAFGRPSRITARVRLGQGEVVDIEREVKLGGPVHSKGVLILSGFLGARYAPDRPLSLSASLVFEQSYSGVEGDSASAAELYALLSAIADVPLRQSLAVTGSVNQRGEVQAVGGINEKIEGFFDVCRMRGLTGDHGVLIPAANVQHLMLRQDVVDAVRAGQFHVYPIETVDQGIALLTGMPAGDRGPDGTYPAGSFNQLVESRLGALAEQRREFGLPPEGVSPAETGAAGEENGEPPEPAESGGR